MKIADLRITNAFALLHVNSLLLKSKQCPAGLDPFIYMVEVVEKHHLPLEGRGVLSYLPLFQGLELC